MLYSHLGQCLVTLGTAGPGVNDGSGHHLLPAHDYATLGLLFWFTMYIFCLTIFSDMKDDGEERSIIFLDPWRKSSSMSETVLLGPGREMHTGRKTPRTSFSFLVFWLC
jgi:hypothetical protein